MNRYSISITKYNIKINLAVSYISTHGSKEPTEILCEYFKNFFLNISYYLSNFLFNYMNTPYGRTSVSPSNLFLNRLLKCKFNLINKNTEFVAVSPEIIKENVKNKQCVHIKNYGGRRKVELKINKTVMTRVYRYNKPCWAKCVVKESLGKRHALISVDGL